MSNEPTPIHGGIIEDVILVDRIERPRSTRFAASSLPGHLLHIVVRGRVRQESGGRSYELEPGHAVWYHEDEPVSGEILLAPWAFYTVNFLAPALSPPPFEERVKVVGDEEVDAFEHLLQSWRDTTVGASVRQMCVMARLLDLLVLLLPRAGTTFVVNPGARLWWDLEAQLRRDLERPIDLALLQRMTRRSLRTIVRSCHEAVGMPPMHRVKQIRLSMARGLVLHSDLRFSEIAQQVGFPRVQEFSRDYHEHFGITPSDDRRAGPDYKRVRSRPATRRW